MLKRRYSAAFEFSRSEHVLGWWDRNVAGASLGTLLIFVAECVLIGKLSRARFIEIAVDAAVRAGDVPLGWSRLERAQDAVSSLLLGLDGIGAVYACEGWKGYRRLASRMKTGRNFWPDPELEPRNDYDTTLYVQSLWRQTRVFPALSFRKDMKLASRAMLEGRFGSRPVIALHLKNVPNVGNASISIADQGAWRDFIEQAGALFDIGFILIGDDAVAPAIRTLPNVAVGKDLGAETFAEHLSFIEVSVAFMGMMSGLSNFALFSRTPYAIFKNPDHHCTEMLSEIGTADHYCFALPGQKVLRVNETTDILLAELRRILASCGESQ